MFEQLSSGFVVGRLSVLPTVGSRPTLGEPEFAAAADSTGDMGASYLVAHLPGCYLRVWADTATPAETLAVPAESVDEWGLTEGPIPVLFARAGTARRLDRWLG
ncbi:DUF5802 family protein [Haloarchaeobius sp. HME9146]|uniref:DUF5802 family protein n=1 Tax=unclassified Haloarchaeobius TaxID=2614452 RepID=UPI0021BF7B54|nr:DUF5802 family protein [Haloarchaeobius sp. HME9146]MCT9098435.1 DUF5802 family protein [Haloarchaeobius sp. HME9146]